MVAWVVRYVDRAGVVHACGQEFPYQRWADEAAASLEDRADVADAWVTELQIEAAA